MKKVLGILMGIVLIAVGVIYALDVFNIAPVNISLDGWWTIFIIVPGLTGLITSKDKVGNLIVLAIGIYLLLAARGIIEYGVFWKLIVPTIIVLIGIKIIAKSLKGDGSSATDKDEKSAEFVAAFNKKEVTYSEENLSHACIGAVFGGTKCNLSGATFKKDSRIDLFCLFGGADIIVPEDVEIKINAFSLFGGISDKRAVKSRSNPTAELTVNGFCMFGGADIR